MSRSGGAVRCPLSGHLTAYADVGNRTRDLRTTNAVRYLLCHVSQTEKDFNTVQAKNQSTA